MAWIHPITTGDYRVVSISTSTTQATDNNSFTYDGVFQNDISGTDLSGLFTSSSDWLAMASVLASADADFYVINTHPTAPIYNTNPAGPELVANNAADLKDGTLINSISYDLAGLVDTAPVWTGSEQDGSGAVGNRLADTNPNTGDPSITTAGWIEGATAANTEAKRVYGLSNEVISTISGSVSGTLNFTNYDTLYVVGNLILTGDITLNGSGFFSILKNSPDVSQQGTITGDYFIHAFSTSGWHVKVKDKGNTNTISNTLGTGLKVR